VVFLFEHHLRIPMLPPPPDGWSSLRELPPLEQIQRIADTPAIRDLDRIISEGAHIASSSIAGLVQ
jgi:hypothetical protein